MAPVITGAGPLSVDGGFGRGCGGKDGQGGRVRLETFSDRFTGQITGSVTRSSPVATFVPTGPSVSVRVTTIAGVAVPAQPTGAFTLPDVTISEGAATVVTIEAHRVPPGTIVKLYLFSESGVVMKADVRNPARALAPAGQGVYEVSSAAWRRSDGMMELYDAKGAQFVTYDPQRDRFVPGSERRLTPRGRELSGLARTSTGLYAVTLAGEGAGLFVCANDHCTRTCPAISLPAEVQSLDTYAGASLVTAWTSITETLQLVLHVETIDPARCVRTPVVTVELDRVGLRPFLKRGVNLDTLLREARRRGTSAEIEAIAVR